MFMLVKLNSLFDSFIEYSWLSQSPRVGLNLELELQQTKIHVWKKDNSVAFMYSCQCLYNIQTGPEVFIVTSILISDCIYNASMYY